MKKILILIMCMSFCVLSACDKQQIEDKTNINKKSEFKDDKTERIEDGGNKVNDNKNPSEYEDASEENAADSFDDSENIAEYKLTEQEISEIDQLIDKQLNEIRVKLCNERIETEDVSKYGDVSQEFANVVCAMTYDKIIFEKSEFVYDGQKVYAEVNVSIPKMEFDLAYIASQLSMKEMVEFYKQCENVYGREYEELLIKYYTIALSKMPLAQQTVTLTVEIINGEWQIVSGITDVESYIKGE